MGGSSIRGWLNPTQPPEAQQANRIARAATWGIVGIAAIALLSWLLGQHQLAAFWPSAIPMAPSTAMTFAAAAFVLGTTWSASLAGARRYIAPAVALAIAAMALFGLVPSKPVDQFLRRRFVGTGVFRGFPLGVMSSTTAAVFLGTSFGLALRAASDSRAARQVSALVGLATASSGLVIVLGYVFGAPVLRTIQNLIPVAFATGAAFVLLGTGIIAAAGADTWPLNKFAGDAIHHKLARSFFPLTAASTVVVAWTALWTTSRYRESPAFGVAVLLCVSLLLVGVVTARVADAISKVLSSSEQQRNLAQQARRRAEAQAASILEGAGEGIAGIDAEGRISFMNPAGIELFGYEDAGAVRGEPHERLFHVEVSEGSPARGCAVCESLRTGSIVRSSTELFRSNRTTFPARVVVSHFREANGAAGVVASFADLSEQRSLEQQLRQAQKMEAVGRLAGGIAHDFNNLLGVILSYGELLLEENRIYGDARQDLEEIKRAAERAAELTRQLLAFSRQQVLQPRIVDLNATVRDMILLVQRLVGEDIEVVVSLAHDLGRVEVDPGQVGQVIMNLVVNSRDAMPDGGRLTIETANVELDERYAADHVDTRPGPYVMLAVSDSGIGMDAATQARIFEPFFTTKDVGKGTGLGLSTVFGIVKQSQGHIWVQSEPGRGATFKVYFPRVERELDISAGGPRGVGGTETILVVEDEPSLRQAIVRVLTTAGYTVVVATNGADALATAEPERVDLVVADVIMPAMGGRELVIRLRERNPSLRALYLSGYTDRGVVHNTTFEIGAPFLQKPFTPAALREKVRGVLGGNG